MTQAQVREIYGKPSKIAREAGGEVWLYKNRVRSRDFIPVYGAFSHKEGGKILFDAHGRVIDSKWGNVRFRPIQ